MVRFVFIYRVEYLFDLLSVNMYGNFFDVFFHVYLYFCDGCYWNWYLSLLFHLGQSIQECTKWNLWKTAFKTLKNLKWYGLLQQNHFKFFKGCLPQISLGPLLRLSSTNLIWSILEYFVLYILCTLSVTTFVMFETFAVSSLASSILFCIFFVLLIWPSFFFIVRFDVM